MKRLILLAALAACGGKKTDYSGAKLTPQAVSVDGLSYTVDIPEGLPKDDRNPGDWSDAKEEYDHTPKVFTGLYPLELPANAEDAKRDVALSPDKGTFARNEQRPTGWAITIVTDDKHRIEASSLTKVGGKLVKCHAVQVGDGEVPSYDKTKAMLEAICDSIKAK